VSEFFKEYKTLLTIIGIASVVLLVVAMIAVPIIVNRMSADYFLDDRDPATSMAQKHPVLRWIGIIAKNLCGGLLLIAGIIMLATPGQGLLTIFMGLVLLDFKGKRALEVRLIQIKPINVALNWIRQTQISPR